MSTLSNNLSDYYFFTTKTGSVNIYRIVLAEKDYWDNQGYKHGTLSWSGDGINFALMDKIKKATGLQVAEVVGGVIEIWQELGGEFISEIVKGVLELHGMKFNPAMVKAWKNFDVDHFDEEE